MENLVLRNTPKIADSFVFETCDSTDGFDCYKISAKDKKIVISGNNNVAKAMGYYRYLKEYCNVLLTSGDFDISYIKTAPLPKEEIACTVPQKIRMAMTYERAACQSEAWGFDRWEKELDFMAMNGVNTPVIIAGCDGVLFKALLELRIKEENALEFISGSSFFPRQLTGNVFGYLPLGSADYFDKKINIGFRATERAKELGMSPVHQGYIPTVPFTFRKNYSKADLIKMPVWNQFAPSMTLDPSDTVHIDLFIKTFLNKQKELLGEVHNYIYDPLYDVDFKGYNSYVDKMTGEYLSLIKDFDPEATWFAHCESLPNINVKLDSLVLIDENGSAYDNSLGFAGNDFVVGYRGNIYGRTVICGDMETLAENPYSAALKKYPNAAGTGLFFDCDYENQMFYSLACKMLTESGSASLKDFTRQYSLSRYGTDEYAEDLLSLQKLCYCRGSALNQASALCARPCTEIEHTAPHDTFERPYDNKELFALAKKMIYSGSKKNDNLRKDLQNILRQVLSNLLRPLYLQATECFFRQQVQAYEKTSNAFMEIVGDIDRLLKTVKDTNIFTHMERARQLGDAKALRQNLEINFLMYHTVWGPFKNSQIYDISWREWGGMINDLYAKRWYLYFRMMASYFEKPKKFKDMSKRKVYDRNRYAETLLGKRLEYIENEWVKDYIPRPDGIGEEDVIEVAKELAEKYDSVINEF